MSFNSKKITALFSGSAIMRFSKKCYDMLFSGFFGSLFSGYSAIEEKFEAGILKKKDNGSVASWQDSVISRTRRKAIVSYENSRIVSGIADIRDRLLCARLRAYGFFFIYFGICMLLMNLIGNFSETGGFSYDFNSFIGVLIVLGAFPLLSSGKTLAAAICESFLISHIVFGFLGYSRAEFKAVEEKGSGQKRYFISALLGALLGCLSYAVPPLLIVLAVFAVIGAGMVYTSPEIGVLLTVFAAPFLTFIGSPSMILAALIVFTFVCACIKWFLGKLIVRFEITDIAVAIFMLVMLMGGVISVGGGGSLKAAAIYTCFLLAYFLIVFLVRDNSWLRRLMLALVGSGALTALYGLYQMVSGDLEKGTMDSSMFGEIEGRVTSTFGVSNMLGVFLIMMFPFALGLLFSEGSALCKLFAAFSCGVMGACLVFTWSRGAWLGLVLSCAVFVLLYSHYILPLIIPAGALGITLLWDRIGGSGIMGDLVKRFTSITAMTDTSSLYRFGIWRGSLNAAKDNLIGGIGIGEEAFRKVYIKYAESGIETAMHSHNLYLQILVETGIVGLAVFICIMLLCISSGLEIIKRTRDEVSACRIACTSGVSALAAALLQGMTDHLWFNYRIFFFFWVVCAVISASSRIGRKKLSSENNT